MRLLMLTVAASALFGGAMGPSGVGVVRSLVDPPPDPPAPTVKPLRQNRPANPITYVSTTAAGVPVKLVVVDMNNPDVRVSGAVAAGSEGALERWNDMIDRTRPAVAITGTYFDPPTGRLVGDLVIGGKMVRFGGIGTAFCVDSENHASMRKAPPNRHLDWSDYEYVLRSGPRLVWKGKVDVNPRGEGFRDPELLRRNGRIGVGITRDNRLILAATRKPITLHQFGRAMKALGAYDAINLDAGRSMGLYVEGKTVIAPHRRLTNLLLVFIDPTQYEVYRDHMLAEQVTAVLP
jgi:hypothetical protein